MRRGMRTGQVLFSLGIEPVFPEYVLGTQTPWLKKKKKGIFFERGKLPQIIK